MKGKKGIYSLEQEKDKIGFPSLDFRSRLLNRDTFVVLVFYLTKIGWHY